jgi:hypothetical protein
LNLADAVLGFNYLLAQRIHPLVVVLLLGSQLVASVGQIFAKIGHLTLNMLLLSCRLDDVFLLLRNLIIEGFYGSLLSLINLEFSLNAANVVA